MNSLMPYVVALGLLVLATILYRNTSPHSARGGTSYEWLVRRRMLATILFALAAICGVFAGVVSLAAYFNAPFFSGAGAMSITPLGLGAWAAIYSGFTLVRSSMARTPREMGRFGSGRRHAAVGYVLIAAGVMILLALVVRHVMRTG